MHEKPLILVDEAAVPPGCIRIDSIPIATRELAKLCESDSSLPTNFATVWAYYPWSNTAVRIPDEEVYFLLRTARNRDLITREEQAVFRNAAVGIAGLSVGSAVVESLVMSGGPKQLRMADPDTIELTNLNRIKAGLPDVGAPKALVAARRAWEIDPFADIDAWASGINQHTVESFVKGLDVVVDEMDSIPLKFSLRDACKVARIPLVMGTDNGDGAIIDIERFDLEPERPIFHGRVGQSANTNPTTREEFSRLAAEIIDPALFTERQAESVARVGKSLAGVPQLATAAAITGAAVAYVVRSILAGTRIASGRYSLRTEALLATPIS